MSSPNPPSVNLQGNLIVVRLIDAKAHEVVAHVHSAEPGLLYVNARAIRYGEKRSLTLDPSQARELAEAMLAWAAGEEARA